MSIQEKITLSRVIAALPLSEKTIYNGHSMGKYPWLSRVSPWGTRTRELWVDIPALIDWASVRGITLNLRSIGGGQK